MKEDLKSYLNFSKKSVMENRRWQSIDAEEDNSASAIYSHRMRLVGNMHDSVYVKPQNNFKVKQDDDPKKKAV